MIFGINRKNKWIGNFITSLTLSILSLVGIQITFAFSLSDELKKLIVKTSCLVTFISNIVSFLIIKYNSSKIFRVYDQIEEYQIKNLIEFDNYF